MITREDVALARTRVVLAEIAPEIPETEVIPSADLREDLRLDELTIWALAVGLEKLAKVQMDDDAIEAARTVADVVKLAESDIPADYMDLAVSTASEGAETSAAEGAGGTEGTGTAEGTPAAQGTESGAQGEANATTGSQSESAEPDGSAQEESLADAMADLANFFNS